MNMIATRIRQIALLLFATLLSGMAFLQMFFRVDGYISANYAAMLILVMVLFFLYFGVFFLLNSHMQVKLFYLVLCF